MNAAAGEVGNSNEENDLFESNGNNQEAKPVVKSKKPKAKSARTQTRRKAKKEPMPTTRPTTVEEWIQAKKIAPIQFTVDSNGDLVVPPFKAGEAEMTIPLRAKQPATDEHIKKFFLDRIQSLKEAEEEFAAAKREAQQMYIAYKREEAELPDLLKANKKVAEAQVKLTALVKFPRSYELLKGLVENDLSFDWYRRSKIADPVGTVITTEFPWKAFWTEAADQIPEFDEEAFESDDEGMSGGAKPKRELTAQQRAIIANYRKKRMGAH